MDASVIVLALTLTAGLHHFASSMNAVWLGVVEHLYSVPILLAGIRGGWLGGLLAWLFSVLAIAWSTGGLPVPIRLDEMGAAPGLLMVGVVSGWMASKWRRAQAEMTKLRQELDARNEMLAHTGKLTAAGELAVGLAHELRHPAASIRGIVDLLKDPTVHPEVVTECLSILDRECGRIERLLNELLRFARPRTPEITKACPHEVVDGAFALVRYAAGEDRVRLQKEIDPGLPALACDREHLKQVMVNLLLNAVQAMPEGGTVTVKARREPERAEIEVIDEGRGIAPELMDKVFLPFVTSRPEGTGLGLTMAKQMVLQHGGELSARRNTGRGMTFRILLPLHEEGAP
jgi:signal transduction histidine kinase